MRQRLRALALLCRDSLDLNAFDPSTAEAGIGGADVQVPGRRLTFIGPFHPGCSWLLASLVACDYEKPARKTTMMDENRGSGAEAAWREQRAEIAKRNAEAHGRGQAERESRERAIEARGRIQAVREAAELDELNAQIAKRRSDGGV